MVVVVNMSIAENLKKNYSGTLICIKNCNNRNKKRELIRELINNLTGAGCNFSERNLSEALGVSRQLVHSILMEMKLCKFFPKLLIFLCSILSFFKVETRGRKKFEDTHRKIVKQIRKICRKSLFVDSSLKDRIIYIDITLEEIQKKLREKYNYTGKNLPSKNTISRILKEKLGYKITKVKKDKVFKKIKETDIIFLNVFKKLDETMQNANIIAISVDDKASKYIGKLSALGSSWIKKHALDHDTNPTYIAKIFGIMDIKSKIVDVFCNISNSTARFKVDCIEEVIKQKLEINKLANKVMIFLDNGPENSSRRKLWMKNIILLAIKYNITIELVYYPPYHSKYNKIEHYWGVLQRHWGGMIIDTLEKLIGAINSSTWDGKNVRGHLRIEKQYEKGEEVDEDELNELILKHVKYENKDIERYSVIINP